MSTPNVSYVGLVSIPPTPDSYIHPPTPPALLAKNLDSSSLQESAPLEKVDVVETPVKPWTEQAEKLISESRSGYTLSQLVAFENLINTNKEQINKLIETDSTIFHLLAKYGTPLEFVRILAQNGIDFGVQDVYRNTALMWAIANAQNGMAKEILSNLPSSQKDSLNAQSSIYQNNSALHLLVAKGYTSTSVGRQTLACSNFELIQKVVALGANVNIADDNGNTPLHLAYLRRDAQVIKFLLEHGADRHSLNHTGLKPVQFALMSERDDLNYSIARAILSNSAGGRFFDFSEDNYKDIQNLKAIISL